jgi:hypothetical protein
MNREIDLSGVFLSGAMLTAILALLAVVLTRRLLGALGPYRHLWHPALADAALFIIFWAVATALLIGN